MGIMGKYLGKDAKGHTYYMVEIENKNPSAVAKILNVSKRTIYTQISDCIGRGWLQDVENIPA